MKDLGATGGIEFEELLRGKRSARLCQAAGDDAAGRCARDEVENLSERLSGARFDLHEDPRRDDAADTAAVDREDLYRICHLICPLRRWVSQPAFPIGYSRTRAAPAIQLAAVAPPAQMRPQAPLRSAI